MFFARIAVFVLLVSVIVFQYTDAWRRRRRRRCPIRDCEVSYWSSWGPCSAYSCGQRGYQSRSRTIITYSSCGGADCPSSLHQTQQCYSNTPVDCQLSSWSEWSACESPSCHVSGTQSSSRYRITREKCGGTCTSTFRKTQTCSRTSVDCQVSSWSEWSACVKTSTCDLSGIQSSTRDKIVEEKCGGRCSSPLQKTRTCSAAGTPPMSVDCQLNSWSEWGACTPATCDVTSGIQFSTRHKIITEKCGGTCPSILRKSRTCISNFTCRNGGSLNEGSCSCTKGFSGVCCEKKDSSPQGM